MLTLTATPIPRTLQMSLSGVRDMSRHRHAAAQPLPGAGARGRVRRRRRVAARSAASSSAAGRSTTSQPRHDHRRGRRARARRGARGAHRRRARPDVRAPARARDGVVRGGRGRRARGHDHHRERHRQPAHQHAHHRGLGAPGPRAALPAQGPRGPQPRQGVRVLPVPAHEPLTEQAVERLTAIRELTELGQRHQGRHARPRDPRRGLAARRRAVGQRVGGGLRPVRADAARGGRRGARRAGASRIPDVRVDLPVAAFLPEEYVPDVDERVRFYRRLAGSPSIEAVDARRRASCARRFGAPPEPAAQPASTSRASGRWPPRRARRTVASCAGGSTISPRRLSTPSSAASSPRSGASTWSGSASWRSRSTMEIL